MDNTHNSIANIVYNLSLIVIDKIGTWFLISLYSDIIYYNMLYNLLSSID